jgi:hypothetical protein
MNLLVIILMISSGLFGQSETMNYKDLQNYLPKSIPGYEAGEPDGQTMNMQGMSFSSAEIEFTDDEGHFVRITLMDYVGAASMYQAATALWATGMSYEDDEKIARSVKLSDNIVGWEEFEKKEKNASLALGIGERFFLSIQADDQDNTDFVKSVANKMDIETLANKSK